MKPLSEYPRPQFRRDSYLCLNGEWDYKISKTGAIPLSFDGKILVPFSPESKLSGVNHTLLPNEYIIYKLDFKLEEGFVKDDVYLHFLGVDQRCRVVLNGKTLGEHIGGFTPFKFEIKNKLNKDKNTLVVIVNDTTDTSYHSRGKQRLKHGGIWYTPQSGIYLPVFLESTPYIHVEDVKFTPDIDKEEIVINVKSKADTCVVKVENVEHTIPCNEDVPIHINKMHLWSTTDPYLYDVIITTKEDKVYSYFAMRKFSIVKDANNIPRLALNNKPIFMKGILDQGYYQNGLLTPESYEDYIRDIELVKSLGFNTIRKHIKIEIPRWYYECDKRGMIVWQDFVNGGDEYHFPLIALPLVTGIHINDHKYKKFARDDETGRKEAIQEFKDTINYLYNSPCIALWTIFNEGWGQFDAKEVYEEVSKLDNTRLFDHASGWHDQGVSDVKSYHVYFKDFKPKKDKHNRVIILSEFGGFLHPIEGHKQDGKRTYKSFKGKEDWLKRYKKSIETDVIKNIPKGLSASIYTQLSDVEDELNGFVTFDREVIKIEPEKIKEINDKIKY